MSRQHGWQSLDLNAWQETQAALQLRTQIVGKTRLALEPPQNHWWHAALYVTARGLSTSPMPIGPHSLEIEFDFLNHELIGRRNDGALRSLPLRAQPIAEFYQEYLELLRSFDADVPLWPMPQELPDPIRFTEDTSSRPYDRAAVERFFGVLSRVDRPLKAFRGRFLGKCSPSHFWWGSFDIACTRFSGRRAPRHPGGVPGLADWVTREAYSHECISGGWWPGTPGGAVPEAAFYAYAYPEPLGCSTEPVKPAAARYDTTLHEWILPHDAVVRSEDPDALVLEFLQSTYDIASTLGSWSGELVRKGATP